MIYYLFPQQLVTLFLALSPLYTVITFPEDVTDFVGARESIVNVHESKKAKKSIVIELKNKDIETNLIVFTKNHRYSLRLKYDPKKFKEDVEIRSARLCTSGISVKDNKDYEILEGPSSTLFINKTKTPFLVNGVKVKTKECFSKGPPLFLENEMIYFRDSL